MTHKGLWWAVLAIGAALVIAPFAISLPSKAAAGQDMLDGFHPIMQPAQVQATADYYYDVFTPLGKVVPLFSQMPQEMQASFGQMIQSVNVDPTVFQRVPAGLTHYKPLVETMQANVQNYEDVDSLPSFRLFTWFFVVPGALLLVLASVALFGASVRAHSPIGHRGPTTA
jgi:hypothetical protein